MKAIILAAGRGSRLKKHTESCPKGLVKLDGVSLVERMVSSLRKAGIQDISIITGYRRDDYHRLGLPTFHNPNWDRTNMVVSLSYAKDWLKNSAAIICYSDIFVDPQDISNLSQSNGNLVLSYDANWEDLWDSRNENILDDAETFRIENGIVKEIGNRPETLEEIQGQYTGLFKLTPHSWRAIENLINSYNPEKIDQISVTEILQLLIQNQYEILGIPLVGKWGEVDTEEDLELYEKCAREGKYDRWFYEVQVEQT